MDMKDILSMNGGDGENSFAQNSRFTRKVISFTKPILVKAIQDLYCTELSFEVFSIADLGCSVGPNTMSVITATIEAVEKICSESKRELPEIQVFLNDLPGNDFNSVFRSLPTFIREMEEKVNDNLSCFVAGVPGSCHGRLFPRNSLHFVHSSYSIHWLSQVPCGLESEEGFPLNKGKIYISMTSPPCVWKAYLEQFQKDLSLFLKSRSEEMVTDGRMVLILHGRKTADPSTKTNCYMWELLAEALNDMVSQKIVDKEKLDSFNVPYYIPSPEEFQDVTASEGSFSIEYIETFELTHGDEMENDDRVYGENVAKNIRSFTEPLISYHFGEEMLDKMYETFAHILVEDSAKERASTTSIITVLRKK
ncbi:3,7-dimethylxanthine N-methyltransferase CkTbS-like [Tasmannia lanceolata]|uniref:3,7-dimethylxanthine N-methyltransferase CkTbS-like n=1 Tax=Tasmannia lanceolata TaxID=3420 RepID=UPI004064859E